MSDITVIGLGEMGAALAGALVGAGRTVTVWNRTAAKAAPLLQQGARLARDVEAAVRASPVLVICVADYQATAAILDGDAVARALEGRLVVQLSSGLPEHARALHDRAAAAGARYLDGAIAAWPRQIGTPDAAIVASGAAAVFAEAEPVLKLLAGQLSHAGEEVGAALALFNAALSYLAGHWIGFSHGAAICAAEGLPVGMFGEMMAGLSGSLGEDLRHMGRVIAENRFERPESRLRTAGADIARLVELSGDLNIGAAWPAFAASVFQRAVDAGLGDEEHCAIVKTLRMP